MLIYLLELCGYFSRPNCFDAASNNYDFTIEIIPIMEMDMLRPEPINLNPGGEGQSSLSGWQRYFLTQKGSEKEEYLWQKIGKMIFSTQQSLRSNHCKV